MRLGKPSGLLSKQSCSMLIYAAIVFCLVFSRKFNIMSAFFPTNRPPCRKKSILAKVFVWGQKGVACECWQNEYLFENTAICTYFGAICYKIECVLRQNGVRFDAK